MIIAEVHSTSVESNIVEAAQRFKIKASARAFKILSSFYADPLMAIPRELGANAWDAHVKAGNTSTPFEVHVPNTLEPWFSIRDFGTGLSKEDIYTVYTTYFESTKGTSNEFDGCMGLGSKTPFNYTENFTVTSWINGIKYTYNCFVDETGGPSIVLMAEEEAVEHDGLMVKFAVKQDDVGTFVSKIRQAYTSFRMKPKLTGIHDIAYPELKYIHQGDKWGIRGAEAGYNSYNRYNRQCVALMGNYRYPIDVNLVCGYTDCKGVTKDEKVLGSQILQNSVVELMFEIGELDVAPNKETLQYDADDRTRATILKTAAKACTELKERVLAKIASPKTRWEAMKLYAEVNGYNNNGCYLTEIIGRINIPFGTAGEIICRNNVAYAEVMAKCPGGKFTSNRFSFNHMFYNLSSDRFKIRETSQWEADSGDVVVFYTNSDGIKRSRIRHYLTTHYTTHNYPRIYLVEDDSANFADLFAQIDYLGLDRTCVVNIETLPKAPRPPKAPRDPKQKISGGLWFIPLDGIRTAAASDQVCVYLSNKLVEIDPSETYYYIPMRFLTTTITVDKRHIGLDNYQTAALLRYATDKKIIPDDVKNVLALNIKTRYAMKVGKWINIAEIAYKSIKKTETARLEQKIYEVDHRVSITNEMGNFNRLFGSYGDYNATAFFKEIESDDTKTFFKKLRTFQMDTSNVTPMEATIIKMFQLSAKKHAEPTLTLDHVRKIMTTKYMGLFDAIDCYPSSSSVKTLTSIVNFIDKHT